MARIKIKDPQVSTLVNALEDLLDELLVRGIHTTNAFEVYELDTQIKALQDLLDSIYAQYKPTNVLRAKWEQFKSQFSFDNILLVANLALALGVAFLVLSLIFNVSPAATSAGTLIGMGLAIHVIERLDR